MLQNCNPTLFFGFPGLTCILALLFLLLLFAIASIKGVIVLFSVYGKANIQVM